MTCVTCGEGNTPQLFIYVLITEFVLGLCLRTKDIVYIICILLDRARLCILLDALLILINVIVDSLFIAIMHIDKVRRKSSMLKQHH